MNQLPIFVNLRARKVILLGQGEMADAKRRLYERAGAQITDDEQADAALAVVAIEDDLEAEAAVSRLKNRGMMVNAVDRPALCDYTTPAIIDRDPVLVAIGTGGASAGLAKALRQRIEQLLPASLGRLAKALYTARDRIIAIWPDGSERRRAIDAVLEPGAKLDPFQDFEETGLSQWLSDPEDTSINRVIDLDLTSNDPDDLTLKQARLLGQADAILAADDVSEAILVRARADAQRFPYDSDPLEDLEGIVLRLRINNE